MLAARRAGRRRLLVHLPTGAGKTVIFSHLAQARAAAGAGARPPRGAADAGPREAANARSGGAAVVAIERGALRASADAQVLVCSIRSLHEERLAKRAARARRGAHRLRRVPPRGRRGQPARAAPARRLRADLRRARCSASPPRPSRGDGQGLDEVFEEIVYSRALPELIEDGFLAPLRGYRISTTADLRQLSPDGPRLRRGAAGRGRRHRGAQRAGRAVDPGAGARSADDRVLRDGEPRPPPGPRAERARRSRRHRPRRHAGRGARAGPAPTSARGASRSSRTWAC